MDRVALEVVHSRTAVHQVLLLNLRLFDDVVGKELQVLIYVAIDFNRDITGTVELKCQCVAILYSLYPV